MGDAVVVTGLMGAGKSTLARALAERLGLEMRDSDLDIEAVHGRDAAAIAEADGAAALHALEAEHVLGALAGPPVVVAAAAWVVEDERVRAALGAAYVVFIEADPRVLAERFARQAHRPVYGEAVEVLREQHERRLALFREVADLVVPLGDIDDQVTAVLEGLARRPG